VQLGTVAIVKLKKIMEDSFKMKIKRRLLAFFLIFALTLASLSIIPVSASGTGTNFNFSVTTQGTGANSNVVVTIKATGDNFKTFGGDLTYDPAVLEYASVTGGISPVEQSGKLGFIYFSTDFTNGQVASAFTATITFKVKAGATAATTQLTNIEYSYNDVATQNVPSLTVNTGISNNNLPATLNFAANKSGSNVVLTITATGLNFYTFGGTLNYNSNILGTPTSSTTGFSVNSPQAGQAAYAFANVNGQATSGFTATITFPITDTAATTTSITVNSYAVDDQPAKSPANSILNVSLTGGGGNNNTGGGNTGNVWTGGGGGSNNTGSTTLPDAGAGASTNTDTTAVTGLVVTGGAVVAQRDLDRAYTTGSIIITGASSRASDGTPRPVVFTIPVSTLRSIGATATTRGLKTPFIFVFTSNVGSFYLPTNIQTFIPNYNTLVTGLSEVSVRVTIQESRQTLAGALSAIVSFKLELVGSNGTVKEVSTFTGPIIRTIIIPNNRAKPSRWAVQRRLNSTAAWERFFVPAIWVTTTNVVTITTNSLSEYVVTERKVTLADITGHWAEENISEAFSKFLVAGRDTAGTQYDPQGDVTRAEFITMMVRALRLDDAPANANQYADAATHWAGADILKARAVNLIGLLADNNNIQPDKAITREEMAYIVSRAATYLKAETPTIDVAARYTDAGDIGTNFVQHVGIASGMKILEGKGSTTTFIPKDTLTRAEAATVLIRFCRMMEWME